MPLGAVTVEDKRFSLVSAMVRDEVSVAELATVRSVAANGLQVEGAVRCLVLCHTLNLGWSRGEHSVDSGINQGRLRHVEKVYRSSVRRGAWDA